MKMLTRQELGVKVLELCLQLLELSVHLVRPCLLQLTLNIVDVVVVLTEFLIQNTRRLRIC